MPAVECRRELMTHADPQGTTYLRMATRQRHMAITCNHTIRYYLPVTPSGPHLRIYQSRQGHTIAFKVLRSGAPAIWESTERGWLKGLHRQAAIAPLPAGQELTSLGSGCRDKLTTTQLAPINRVREHIMMIHDESCRLMQKPHKDLLDLVGQSSTGTI